MLDAAAYRLANDFQRDFPLVPLPFREIASALSSTEEKVLLKYEILKKQGVIDRIGPVFRPNTVGASTLAAMAVPPERLDAVAAFVSAQSGVNHNYERTNRHNLWFVVTGATEGEVQWTLSCIEHGTGLRVLRLPLLEEYHIDLGFDLASLSAPRNPAVKASRKELCGKEKKLVAATVAGLPLVARPYAAVAKEIGVSEADVIESLQGMLADGRIRRIGAVVRHRRVGYEANAMAVWDVPDDAAGARGAALAADPAVTLCYRRGRAVPEWPYNLYCMVHGRERAQVGAEVARLAQAHGLAGYPHEVLFSERCFSQKAAKYG